MTDPTIPKSNPSSVAIPSFKTRDSSTSDFWTERFEHSFTPWDKGGVPLALQNYILRTAPVVTLIPGCGVGYEAAYLASAGWDVTAIDFSEAAVRAAQMALGSWGARVKQADFFTFVPDHPLGLIYERAFLCALPPALRPNVVQRWAALLPAGATLAGFFFFGDSPKGPPFGIDRALLERLLHPYFELIEDQAVMDSIPAFADKERWQVWHRRR
ncbi:methyltransferase domain-containing protein [Glaciimonas immobilis]|uniref:SAM-dependent methyltransferase n=1 Tax=Glaciimonas immobilis TaxID=728004 RepID=A0A840RSB5_9BURK|nr:methyltransferase domain-containing protein [Glaciimonas immobilis]KAF3998536.1 methyltransferase domain-containing protein [Glaciimonas immobilis]MBB5201387.1 SAM-dependent methyltransferase [Glaciimonas immobilis]